MTESRQIQKGGLKFWIGDRYFTVEDAAIRLGVFCLASSVPLLAYPDFRVVGLFPFSLGFICLVYAKGCGILARDIAVRWALGGAFCGGVYLMVWYISAHILIPILRTFLTHI